MNEKDRNQTVRMSDDGPDRAVLELTQLFLKVTQGPERGAEAALRPTAVFGRDEGCDLVLTDPFLSGRHARIESTPDGVWLEDLASTNGTRINGVRVERARIERGDRVQVGKTILQLESRGEREVVYPGLATGLGGMVGQSSRMRLLFSLVGRIATTDLSVLVQGETGTGKELLARAVHDLSQRRDAPFVAVDSASLSTQLAGSELFGHEKGAFTGAERRHAGAFERAHGGTLFLDEIGELSPEVQSQLLRVLETGRFTRIGGEKTVTVDVRVVAATHQPLQRQAESGRFRRDLLYRINQVNLLLPPLRERVEDLPLLVEQLVGALASTLRRQGEALSFHEEAIARLTSHDWPGNVRELKNFVAQTLAMAEGPVIMPADLPPFASGYGGEGGGSGGGESPSPQGSLEDVKRKMITDALLRHKGNKAAAARELGVAVSTFWDWVKRYGID